MAIEIERKFLLLNNAWRNEVSHSCHYQQGYLSSNSQSSIRIRTADDQAWLNIKSATIGNQRLEYEYSIPLADAKEIMAQLCNKPVINKTRYFVHRTPHLWEIDEFYDDNDGLIVAEIELSTPDEHFELPEWLGAEVTQDLRYYNNNLIQHPYREWRNN